MIAELSTRLNDQLDHLVEELTERIPVRLGSEHGQVAYAEMVDRQKAIQRRVQYLRRVADGLALVEPRALVQGRVGYGSQVRLEDLQSGEIVSYTVMNGDGLDLDAGEISIASPVAQALLGRKEGEVVEVATPQRTRRFRVLSTTTLFDLLGLYEQPSVECA